MTLAFSSTLQISLGLILSSSRLNFFPLLEGSYGIYGGSAPAEYSTSTWRRFTFNEFPPYGICLELIENLLGLWTWTVKLLTLRKISHRSKTLEYLEIIDDPVVDHVKDDYFVKSAVSQPIWIARGHSQPSWSSRSNVSWCGTSLSL